MYVMLIPVTATSSDTTFTGIVAVNPPSLVLAVMVVSPVATPSTTPLFTVAIELFAELHVIDLLVASEGAMVAVRVDFSPISRLSELLSSFIPDTGMVVGASSPPPHAAKSSATMAKADSKYFFIVICFYVLMNNLSSAKTTTAPHPAI
jgi:hypothetical protein